MGFSFNIWKFKVTVEVLDFTGGNVSVGIKISWR